jgi:hypothetical protein
MVDVPAIEESAPAVEEAAPIMEEPIEEVSDMEIAVEQPAIAEEVPMAEEVAQEIEQPAEDVPSVEVPIDESPIIEEAAVEQPEEPIAETMEASIEEASVAEEVAAPEPEPEIVEEIADEKRPLDEFDVAEHDIVQKELLQLGEEETTENPFLKAPMEAQEEANDDIPVEVSDETQPVSIHTAKENLLEVSSSDDEEKEYSE